MFSNHVLQTAIEELKEISRADMCIINSRRTVVATTFEQDEKLIKNADKFMKSEADSQTVGGFYYFKIVYDDKLQYVLLAKGNSADTHMLGRIAVSQIEQLLHAYKDKLNREGFIHNLLSDHINETEIHSKAQSLHISTEARRVLFLIEVKDTWENEGIEMLKSLFNGRTQDFVIVINDRHIALLKELKRDEGYEELEETARIIVDMLGAEAMITSRASYGSIVSNIGQISKSYKEAKIALEVGTIFHSFAEVLSYRNLGIGRLIYQLPVPLCEIFIGEVFRESKPEDIEEEVLVAVDKFFETNLNISETARQLYIHRNTLVYRLEKLEKLTGLDVRHFEDALTFKLAVMVVHYMQYRRLKHDGPIL